MKRYAPLLVSLAALSACGCSVLSKIPINLPTPPVASPKPPVTQPTPPNFPGPGPSTPPPAKSCPQITDDDAAVVDQTQQYAPDYASAILALKARHPDWFVQTDTGWRVPQAGDKHVYPTAPAITAFRAQFYLELGQEFAKSGLCFVTIGDELHVYDSSKTPIVSERYKPFEQAQGNEEQKAYVGRTLAVVLGPTQPPTPAPPTPPANPTPTAPAIPAPVASCPPTLSKLADLKVMSHPGNRFNINVTAQYCDGPRITDYCGAHGFFDTNGNPRTCCPLGPEGEGTSRKPCELQLVGDTSWTVLSGSIERLGSQAPPGGLGAVWVNPDFTTGVVQACAVKAPGICATLSLP